MNGTILLCGLSVLAIGIFTEFQKKLETWTGFLLYQAFWYIGEYCYYLILFYFTTLDFIFSFWLMRNFEKSKRESNYKYRRCHKNGMKAYKVSMALILLTCYVANILIVFIYRDGKLYGHRKDEKYPYEELSFLTGNYIVYYSMKSVTLFMRTCCIVLYSWAFVQFCLVKSMAKEK